MEKIAPTLQSHSKLPGSKVYSSLPTLSKISVYLWSDCYAEKQIARRFIEGWIYYISLFLRLTVDKTALEVASVSFDSNQVELSTCSSELVSAWHHTRIYRKLCSTLDSLVQYK